MTATCASLSAASNWGGRRPLRKVPLPNGFAGGRGFTFVPLAASAASPMYGGAIPASGSTAAQGGSADSEGAFAGTAIAGFACCHANFAGGCVDSAWGRMEAATESAIASGACGGGGSFVPSRLKKPRRPRWSGTEPPGTEVRAFTSTCVGILVVGHVPASPSHKWYDPILRETFCLHLLRGRLRLRGTSSARVSQMARAAALCPSTAAPAAPTAASAAPPSSRARCPGAARGSSEAARPRGRGGSFGKGRYTAPGRWSSAPPGHQAVRQPARWCASARRMLRFNTAQLLSARPDHFVLGTVKLVDLDAACDTSDPTARLKGRAPPPSIRGGPRAQCSPPWRWPARVAPA
mmetsp:Transcript_92462/g.249513  ORF Transcript_92462/g.249513 Transcript_92462/m.249513 type:complete len:350 (+) Transcript_92462:345-1394(+)